jgi:co-chaperonin GroES (HSP10)
VKLEPLGNRVILEEIGESKMTRGGLLIPDAARKNKAIGYGRVLAVGPGRYTGDGKLIPCWCKEGDVIMFPRQAPAVLPLVDEHGNEKDVLMCPDNDIIGIVHDLPQVTHIAGLDGALLKMQPVSLARPGFGVREHRGDRRVGQRPAPVGCPAGCDRGDRAAASG